MAFIILMGFIALIALPSVIWVYALADVIRNDFLQISTKIVWIINLFVFPPLGTILYFLIGRNQRTTNYPVGRIVVFWIFIFPVLLVVAYFLFSLGHLTFLPEPPETIRIQRLIQDCRRVHNIPNNSLLMEVQMPLYIWDNTYSVNNEELDNHHKKLFDLFNKLYDCSLDKDNSYPQGC